MAKLMALILDDEQLAIDTLSWQLKQYCPRVRLSATFTNPNDALNYLQDHQVDLCFLDINMPEMSGFEFLEHWQNSPPFTVIFTTAYDEFAIKAFKVSAFDYLLKPIDETELVNALDKLNKQKAVDHDLNQQINLLSNRLKHPDGYPKRIALATLEGVHFIDVRDIIRLEADSNYTTIILDKQENLLISKSLSKIEGLLDPQQFLRIHQSHTVNLAMIKLYRRGRGGSVLLCNQEQLPVSQQRKAKLLVVLGMEEP